MARNTLKSPEGIVRYANVFTARARKGDNGQPEGEPKFSILLVFEKDADLSEMEEAIEEAATKKFGSKAAGLLANGKLKSPIRDASDYVDDEKSKEENWPFNIKGAQMVRFATKDQPGIVDENADPIMDKTEFYDGCRARVSYNAGAYDTKGNKGVALYLINVQKLDDGKRLSGNPNAEDDFKPAKASKPAAKKSRRNDDDDDLLG